MLRAFKTSRGMVVAACAAVGLALAIGGVVVLASGTSPKVCVPKAEGKAVVTPIKGVCKAGYTLTEIGKEGPPGPAGKSIISRIRTTEVASSTSPTFTTLPLSGATWVQGPEELDEFAGQLTVSSPPVAECTESPGGRFQNLKYRISIDGGVILETSVGLPTTEHGETVTQQLVGLIGQFLFEPRKTETHAAKVEVADGCGIEGGKSGGHFKINAFSMDVLGAR